MDTQKEKKEYSFGLKGLLTGYPKSFILVRCDIFPYYFDYSDNITLFT